LIKDLTIVYKHATAKRRTSRSSRKEGLRYDHDALGAFFPVDEVVDKAKGIIEDKK
jgi:hypothetical protein